jgi:hypothetical protein
MNYKNLVRIDEEKKGGKERWNGGKIEMED